MCVHNANVYANIYTDEEHPAQLIIAKMLKLTLIYEHTTDEHHHLRLMRQLERNLR